MLIAFEGPDKAGKSTWARELSGSNKPFYSLKKSRYELLNHDDDVVTVDRLAWLTHSAYRLALPEYEWNDREVRTVFAMPDAHLVFMVPDDPLLDTTDKLYTKQQSYRVQEAYREWCWLLFRLNNLQNGALFRTISLLEIRAGGINGRIYKHFAINYSGLSDSEKSCTGFNLGETSPRILMNMLKEFE